MNANAARSSHNEPLSDTTHNTPKTRTTPVV